MTASVSSFLLKQQILILTYFEVTDENIHKTLCQQKNPRNRFHQNILQKDTTATQSYTLFHVSV